MGRNFWLIFAAILALSPLLTPYDDTDPVTATPYWGRSGLALYTDNKTGCQYVKAGYFGGITPRLDEQGRPICRK